MEEKRGDNGRERSGSERLTIQDNKNYTRRPYSNRPNENYSVSCFSDIFLNERTSERTNVITSHVKINRRQPRSTTLSIVDDERRHQPFNRPLQHVPLQMRSLSSHQISNPIQFDHNQSQHPTDTLIYANDDNEPRHDATYSFRREINKLRSAKSHGELYQPHAPLPLPPMTDITQEDNKVKYRSTYAPDSSSPYPPMKVRVQTTNVPVLVSSMVPSLNEPTSPLLLLSSSSSSSSTQKMPIWKRFKKIITPIKRNKEQTSGQVQSEQTRKTSSPKLSVSHGNEPLSNEISKNERIRRTRTFRHCSSRVIE
jgi:hypothetical protein